MKFNETVKEKGLKAFFDDWLWDTHNTQRVQILFSMSVYVQHDEMNKDRKVNK